MNLDIIVLVIIAIPLVFTFLIAVYMFYATSHAKKVTLLKVEPTPLILAKSIYNEILGYKLLRIKGSDGSAFIFCAIVLLFGIAIGIYKEALILVLLVLFLFAAILASIARFAIDIQFFEHGIIYKGHVGDEKTVLYENIYSVTFSSSKLSTVDMYFIEIYYRDISEDGEIKAIVALDKIDDIINILRNKNVNVE